MIVVGVTHSKERAGVTKTEQAVPQAAQAVDHACITGKASKSDHALALLMEYRRCDSEGWGGVDFYSCTHT